MRVDALFVGLLIAFGLLLTLSAWRAPVEWSPDGLHYQSTLLQIRGADEDTAVREAFDGPIAAKLRADAHAGPLVGDPVWVRRTEPFYERRQLLPAIGAVVYPVLHERTLLAFSLLAYIAIGPLLYVVLRRRFSPSVSLTVAGLVLLAEPLRRWSFYPLMDSTGVALLLAASAAAMSVLEGSRGWIPAWCLALAALSLTRETWVAALFAVAYLAVRRVPNAMTLAVSGLFAVVPAILLFRVPTLEYMNWTFNRSTELDPGWFDVLAGYHWSVWRMLVNDAFTHTLATAWVIVAALWLFRRAPRSDLYFSFWRANFVGGVLMLALLPNATDFRLELVLVPAAAIGTGVLASSVDWREQVARLTVSRLRTAWRSR